MKKILILKDHCDYTFTSLNNGLLNSIDNERLKARLEEKGYDVFATSLHEIDEEQKVEGTYVFYPSSEVSGLFYKEYIEDILLDLELRGLILLPHYKFFRAHHNKVFMELLRNNLHNDSFKTIRSYSIYDCRDLINILETLEEKIKYPMVLKMSSGSGARGVLLANNRKELLKKAKRMSAIKYRNYSMPWYSNPTLSKLKTFINRVFNKEYVIRSYPQEKIVVQNFISNLRYDYKVLVFGKKYYVLKRLTRDNDFRASGSGKLIFPNEIDEEICSVLSLAKNLYVELNVPMLSVDIAYSGAQCHIIEFQCVSFGPYTLQFSNKYYTLQNGRDWTEHHANSILEDEIANALDLYIKGENER